jgi:hypothetical protein
MEDTNNITNFGIKSMMDTKINNIIRLNLSIINVIKAQIF